MDVLLLTLQSGVAQGLLWAILTIGVYITFRLLDFADLTVEGSFPLGAAVAAILINKGMSPIFTLFFALLAGMLAGMCTGILNTVLKIPPILAGILTMISLYSINLRITSDKTNVSYTNSAIKQWMKKYSIFKNMKTNSLTIFIGLTVIIILIVLLYLFFGTEIGCAIRSTGSNANMSRALGVNTNKMIVLGLMISNGLISLSGALVSQAQLGSANMAMGQGAIVIGLASVIIGEVIFCRKDHNFAYILSSIVGGAIIYRMIICIILQYNSINKIIGIFGYTVASKNGFVNWEIKSTDLKLITAIVVAFALSLPVQKERRSFGKRKKENAKLFNDNGGVTNA